MHFLIDVALQENVAVDDRDHAIEHNRLSAVILRGRRSFRRCRWLVRLSRCRRRLRPHRPPSRGKDSTNDRDADYASHQKACPILKKKLNFAACPTYGGWG